MKVGVAPHVFMVADNERNFASQLAVALPVEQVDKAMIVLGDENRHAGTITSQSNAPLHSELSCYRCEFLRELLQWQLESAQVPFDASKIEALLASLMLFKMQNVAVVLKDKIGNRGVETFLIGTLNEQDRRILQDALSVGTSQCNQKCRLPRYDLQIRRIS